MLAVDAAPKQELCVIFEPPQKNLKYKSYLHNFNKIKNNLSQKMQNCFVLLFLLGWTTVILYYLDVNKAL